MSRTEEEDDGRTVFEKEEDWETGIAEVAEGGIYIERLRRGGMRGESDFRFRSGFNSIRTEEGGRLEKQEGNEYTPYSCRGRRAVSLHEIP